MEPLDSLRAVWIFLRLILWNKHLLLCLERWYKTLNMARKV